MIRWWLLAGSFVSAVIMQGVVWVILAPPAISAGHGGLDFPNPLGSSTTIWEFLQKVLGAVMLLAFPAIALFIVYAGFRYLTARGDAGKIKEVHQTLLWAVVGALLILGGWALVQAIHATVCSIAPVAFGCNQ